MAVQPLIGQYVSRSAIGGLYGAGAPGAGTNEVQTLTIGGTPTGGTFKLGYDGAVTAAIPWNATNSTLLASINTALDALGNGGAGWIVATAGTLTAGIGTIILTFQGGDVQRRAVNNITIADNSLTGTAPTLANAETTPGVDATGRFNPVGTRYIDPTNGKEYINTASNPPTWVSVGSQT